MDHQLPTLLLSECVLTYMEVASSSAIIQWAAVSFPNAVFLTYEQIRPDDPFGVVMRKHFEKLNSPLKAIQAYPTIEAQQHRFQALGWQGASAIDMNSYYSRLPLTERQRVESLEPFDEFEEWHLKCSHYAVVAAFNGACADMKEFFGEDRHIFRTDEYLCCSQDANTPAPIEARSLIHAKSRPLRRFGHASTLMPSDKVVVFGGFGEAGSKHMRLGDVVIVDLNTGCWDTVPGSIGAQELGPRMHHTLTAISGGNRLFLFGGRGSPTKPTNSSLIVTLNARQQEATAAEAPVSRNGLTLPGETASDSRGIKNPPTTRTAYAGGSSLDFESSRSDALPRLRVSGAEADGRHDCAEIKEGAELNRRRDGSGTSDSADAYDVNNLSTAGCRAADATLSCVDGNANASLGDVRPLEGLQTDIVDGTLEPTGLSDECNMSSLCHEDKSQTDSELSSVFPNPGVTVPSEECLVLHSRTTDTVKERSCNGDSLHVQTATTGTDSYGLNGLQSQMDTSSRHSLGCEDILKTDSSSTSSSPSNLRNSETRLCRKGATASHCVENGRLPSTETGILSYSCQHIETHSRGAPSPIWRHSAVHAVLNGRECVVVYGGRGTGDAVFGDCWSFDVGKLNWEKLDITGDQLPSCHSHTACMWQGTRKVIAGGLGPNLRPLTSVYVIDLVTFACQEMNLRPLLPPRYSHTAHVVGNRLLLVGGVNPLGAHCYTVAVVDLDTATWQLHSLPAFLSERPLMVHSHSSVLLTETSVAIVGGGGNCFSFGTHLNNTPVEIRVPL